MKIQQIFRDPVHQELFERDGYVVIDLTSADTVQEIARQFYNINESVPSGFSSGATIADQQVKDKLFADMDAALQADMDRAFIHYKKLGSTFLCKAPGENSKVNVHQDWSVVDEKRYASATVWIPTQAVDEHNGALRVLPGSHLFFDKYRNNNIPISYRGSEEMLWENMFIVPMKPGQAFILNHAVLHASPPNMTDKERLVIAYGITSAEAGLAFYYKAATPGSPVEKYLMPDDFFLRYHNIGERPLFGDKVQEFPYEVPAVSGEEIYRMIQAEKEKRRNIPYFREHWLKG
ncbi:MAG: phytanoyl-CoA dioxygenase family protein [Bacteroidetes bacterium]|nr:phytanoyl-CoA dioxygenase family protein [Bacteroidota bacterium]